MQITLTQEEVHAMVQENIRRLLVVDVDHVISIDFAMGRAPNGLTATIDIKAPILAPKIPTKLGGVTTRASASTSPVEEAPKEASEKTSGFSLTKFGTPRSVNDVPAVEQGTESEAQEPVEVAETEVDATTEAGESTDNDARPSRPSIFAKNA